MIEHFKRTSNRPICKDMHCLLINRRDKDDSKIQSNGCRCGLLRVENGRFWCRAYGFRWKNPTHQGVCSRINNKVNYDVGMLRAQKNKKYNFCVYRVLAPITILMALLGIAGIIEVFKLFVLKQ